MNDYNEVRAHLAHFGITGQKKGLRRFQSYAVAPTRSGMVGQETGEAAKQRGRLGKKVKDTAKKAAKDLKNRYKHGITANKLNDSRKVTGAAAEVGAKAALGVKNLKKNATNAYNKYQEHGINAVEKDIQSIQNNREKLRERFSDKEIDDMITGLQSTKAKREAKYEKNKEFQKRRDSGKLTFKDGPMYMVQEGKKFYDKNKPKMSNNFRPLHQNALLSNAKTLRKPAKAVAKGVGIVANETAHTIQDVSKFAPPSVKAARANPKDSFIIKGYQRGQKHRRKKK